MDASCDTTVPTGHAVITFSLFYKVRFVSTSRKTIVLTLGAISEVVSVAGATVVREQLAGARDTVEPVARNGCRRAACAFISVQ